MQEMQADASSIPGWGRFPGAGHDNPLQYSCLKNPMARGAWQTTVHRVTKSHTWLKGRGMQACTNFKILADECGDLLVLQPLVTNLMFLCSSKLPRTNLDCPLLSLVCPHSGKGASFRLHQEIYQDCESTNSLLDQCSRWNRYVSRNIQRIPKIHIELMSCLQKTERKKKKECMLILLCLRLSFSCTMWFY